MISFLIAEKHLYLSGKYNGSKTCGNGVSQPVTRVIGASKFRKHSFWIVAANSAPNPAVNGASWAISARPVLFTD